MASAMIINLEIAIINDVPLHTTHLEFKRVTNPKVCDRSIANASKRAIVPVHRDLLQKLDSICFYSKDEAVELNVVIPYRWDNTSSVMRRLTELMITSIHQRFRVVVP